MVSLITKAWEIDRFNFVIYVRMHARSLTIVVIMTQEVISPPTNLNLSNLRIILLIKDESSPVRTTTTYSHYSTSR